MSRFNHCCIYPICASHVTMSRKRNRTRADHPQTRQKDRRKSLARKFHRTGMVRVELFLPVSQGIPSFGDGPNFNLLGRSPCRRAPSTCCSSTSHVKGPQHCGKFRGIPLQQMW